MAHIFKPVYTVADPTTGKKTRKRASRWYVELADSNGVRQRIRGYTDKSATQALMTDLVKRAEKESAGLYDGTLALHAARELKDHIADYKAHLEAKNDSQKHVKLTLSRLKEVFDSCGITRLAHLDATKVVAHLGTLRQETDKRKGLALRTINAYIAAIRSFARWALSTDRIARNPFLSLAAVNERADVRRVRRCIEPEELTNLLAATRVGPAFRGVSGEDRARLYVVARFSGLRVSELASLTRSSFDLEATPPSVTVEAAYSKRRRCDVQPLPTFLTKELVLWLETRLPRALLWPGTWRERAAEMLRRDLKAAGIDATDDTGRIIDFHALRHAYITDLAQSGIHPAEAQALARHSTIALTIDRYTHVRRVDLGHALEKLTPPPTSETKSEEKQLATGTDPGSLGVTLGVKDAFPCPRVTDSVTSSDAGIGDHNLAASEGSVTPCHSLADDDTKGHKDGPTRTRTWDRRIMSPVL